MRDLRASDIPESPGVYGLYRNGTRMYVGKADSLRDRIWRSHCGRGPRMTRSAMRRNIAEHLGIATANDIYQRRYQPSPDEVPAVRDWLDGCYIAWVECGTNTDALALEKQFKDEFLPPLTKR
jgi:hypothetical protein